MSTEALSKLDLAIIALDKIEEAGLGREAEAIREVMLGKSDGMLIRVRSLATGAESTWVYPCSRFYGRTETEEILRDAARRSELPRPAIAWLATQPSAIVILDDEDAAIAREAVDLIRPLLEAARYGGAVGPTSHAYELLHRIERAQFERERSPRR